MTPFELIGPDPSNPETHSMIRVAGVVYSVFKGTEQESADAIAAARGL